MIDSAAVVGSHCWVPQNRWDLVPSELLDRSAASIAIVVPYFNQPDSLRRMYGAIAAAHLDPRCHRLVIADDGSTAPPPRPPAGFPLPVDLVRQEDRGCRPGAARNLAVASCDDDVLVFLDADTLPDATTVRQLSRWPAAMADALVVGCRHHVDLTGWSPRDTVAWLGGHRASPPRRADPGWLDRGYELTRDLLDADDRSYRYVISAVMSCHRSLYDDIGGFEATRDEYGGEDWEFAYRAFNNGAVFVHDASAVAWHDEPDWSARDGGSKNAETMWLASRIPEPLTRGTGPRHLWPDVVMSLNGIEADEGQVVATIHAVLAAIPDCGIHLARDISPSLRSYVAQDSRIEFGPPGAERLARARRVVELRQAVLWQPSQLRAALDAVGPGAAGSIDVVKGTEIVATVTSTRALGRVRRAPRELSPDPIDSLFGRRTVAASAIGVTPVPTDVDLDATFGRW